ncbi:expressed unknown protein [Seminavis robusta]|uniref:Uncharacterized protein n=1 Tax=Seminavis robusta TaxID=568900 RepID=A0A9N8DAJ4_9STRA|nr:expressed unknown protein [Seminavis robusta]|eukprot:Sro16_g011590.1 n/a (202) ;mRNA; f:41482-42087
MSERLERLRDHPSQKIGVLLTDDLPNHVCWKEVGKGDAPLEFFLETLDKIKLREPSYWTPIFQQNRKFKNYATRTWESGEEMVGLVEESQTSELQQSDFPLTDDYVDSDVEIATAIDVRGAYKTLLPKFSDVAKVVNSVDEYRILREALDKAHSEILKLQIEGKSAHSGQTGVMLSLPETDKSRKSVRERPLTSPAKKSKR